MSIPTAPRTGLPTITVAVFDSATVFEGLNPSDVIYRYDLPGTGVSEGWAGSSVVDQVRQLAAQSWPDVRVRIDAAPDASETLQRLFANRGVASCSADEGEPEEAPADTDPDTGEFPPVGRHRLRGEDEQLQIRRPLLPARVARGRAVAVPLLVVTAVAVGVGGWLWWSPQPQAADPGEVSSKASNPAPATRSSVPPQPPAATTTAESELRLGTWAVTLPGGFHLEQSEDSVLATGADPTLRIHLTSDPLYSIGPDVLFDEVQRLVDEDPQLTDPVRTENTMSYVEDPGDGSRVRWTTWVEGGNQLSVGCHTRGEASAGQHAACTMATRSFSVSGK